MSDVSTLPGPGTTASAPSMRGLWRSRRDRVIGGVCGGLGHYFEVDPVVLRVAAVLLTLSGGAGVIIYLVAWIAVPVEPSSATRPAMSTRRRRPTAAVVTGVGLLVGGGLLMSRAVMPWWDWPWVWPLLLVAAGTLVTVSAWRR
ncbi:PspC domain-containing protein [Nakamurella flava]|nr:PspC domain-containing protein [Nakamurella flava]